LKPWTTLDIAERFDNPLKLFFNRCVENLVEKWAEGYRKVKDWKSF
jgi:hypothetical protein